jgi:two-component system phosphate regulon response regulator OmpR
MNFSKSHILIVDDDDKIRDLLKEFLVSNNFLISTASNAEEALEKLRIITFDLLILDIMMPGMDGYELTNRIREKTLVPIIHLTAMGETENIIHGLEIGADDYLSKPFEPRELLLRIKNIINKISNKPNKEQIQLDDIVINLKNGKIKGNSKKVSLNDKEIKILKILSSNPGESFSREKLVKNLKFSQERTLDVCVNRLRKKIEKNPKIPRFLKTKRGSGYVLWLD